MRLGLIAFAATVAAIAIVGCNTTKGVVQDFNATVNTGKGLLNVGYDPTNGVVVTAPADLFGPVKIYKPVPQAEK